MKAPRGLVAVYAAGRPARPSTKAALVRGAGLSPAELSERVATATMIDVDRRMSDPVQGALTNLARTLSSDPVQILATCPQIDTVAIVRVLRLKALEARGWLPLHEGEWPSERRRVQAQLAARLRSRATRASSEKPQAMCINRHFALLPVARRFLKETKL